MFLEIVILGLLMIIDQNILKIKEFNENTIFYTNNNLQELWIITDFFGSIYSISIVLLCFLIYEWIMEYIKKKRFIFSKYIL